MTTPDAGTGAQGLLRHVCSASLLLMSRGAWRWLYIRWLYLPQIKPERVDMFGHIGRLAFQPAWPASARRLNFRHAHRQCSPLLNVMITCHGMPVCFSLG